MNKIMEIIGKMLELNTETRLIPFLNHLGKFEYLVCLDMGCGNTSVAIYKIKSTGTRKLLRWKYWNIGLDGTFEEVVNLSIPTMLGYDGKLQPVIGPEALGYRNAIENFKAVPNKTNLKKNFKNVGGGIYGGKTVSLEELWSDYFQKVFEYILEKAIETYPDFSKENIILVVARPAATMWEKCADKYKDIIVKGTKLEEHQILTFSEAKASMQYIRTEKQLQLNWKNGVIVIDLGASTIDIEYRSYKEPSQEYSITMAGKDVDYLLGNEILSQIYPTEMRQLGLKHNELPNEKFFEDHITELQTSRTLYAHRMRSSKENISSDGTSVNISYCKDEGTQWKTADTNLLHHILSTKKFTFECDDGMMAAFMNNQPLDNVSLTVEGTWYEHLEKLVHFVLQKIGANGKSIDKIIVTGGTANLIGVKEHIEAGAKDAGWLNVPVVVLNQPADYERTVPYGSASYLLNVINNIGMMEKFPETLKEALKNDILVSSTEKLGNKISPIVVKKVYDKIDLWAGLPDGVARTSINGLLKGINEIQIWPQDIDSAIQKANMEIANLIQNPNLPTTIEEIQKFLDSLSMQQKYNDAITIQNVPFALQTNKIVHVISTQFRDLHIFNFFNKWFHLKMRKGGNDTLLKSKHRKKVQEKLKTSNEISRNLVLMLQEEFKKEFEQTDAFGLVDTIIEGLERKIDQAMFM